MSGYRSIFRADLFAGRVVMVTGGGTGLGRCCAHELASLGATVILAARRRDVLERTAGEIREAGGQADCVELNIRDADAIESVMADVIARHGRLDGLFNNAGGQFFAPAENISVNGWKTVIDLNLNGTFMMMHAAYRHWMREHGGAIVNMLADIDTGYPGMAHMAAARAGIENLAKTLTQEWGASDVRINCVAPGTILSSGMLTYPAEVQHATIDNIRQSPSARLGTESEVSAAVVFLLSPGAAHVRGETIHVDGGERLQKRRIMTIGEHPGTRRFDGFHLATDYSGSPFEDLDSKTSSSS